MLSDPYPVYAELRSRFPIFWSETWNSWIVSRYEDVRSTLTDNENLSNECRQEQLFATWSPEKRERLTRLRHYFSQRDVIGSDPPDHNRIRKLVARAFTPRTIARLEPRIRALANQMISDTLGRGSAFDFVAEVAHPLPVIVIAEMLGAPPSDRHLFKKWSADILAFQGTGTAMLDVAEVSQASLLELFGYMTVLIEERQARPRDDVITALARAEIEGERLTRDELLSSCNTLLTAGHETTTNLLGNLVRLLLLNPDAWLALCADSSDRRDAAIEEALRYDAPKQRNFRRVRREHRLHGATLAENDMLFQLIGAANRDSDVFADPDHFDITRTPNNHLSLGLGIHFCLGGPLARVEARAVLDELLRLLPGLKLAGQPEVWQERVQFRGPRELWLHGS
jgi:cytochrome P450